MNILEIVRLYNEEKKSPYEIADLYNTYANKIRRILKKAGVTLRDKGEAQSEAFASGRKEHPTQGKKRSDSVKNKISNKVVEHWENMPDDKYEEYVDGAKKRWKKIPKHKREDMRRKANEGIRKAAKEGSIPENYLAELLRENGFNVDQHRTDIIKNHDLEVDIYIPQISTIIEFDGISHSQPIWSEERLKKAKRADLEKNGLALRNGLVIIRLKYLAKRFTLHVKNQLQEKLVPLLHSFKTQFPPEGKRYIEIEVK